MLRDREPDGPFISRMSAQYPLALNAELTIRLALQAGLDRSRRNMVRAGKWSNILVDKSLLKEPQHQALSGNVSGSPQDGMSGISPQALTTDGSNFDLWTEFWELLGKHEETGGSFSLIWSSTALMVKTSWWKTGHAA